MASTGPLQEIARRAVLAQLEIGTAFLDLEPIDFAARGRRDRVLRDALVRRKQEQGLYSRQPAAINFIGEELLRTNLVFPANVPGSTRCRCSSCKTASPAMPAQYTGRAKWGSEADIYDFAQHRAPLYGLAATVLAIVAGWLASVIFRRG